ncbi:hypothetical protein ZHAS_00017081 [Anopheles sinensis]|uniref:Uncharacterized protein n=1 Tax=Anopheles sinensis TaxID=74873 RepID=A0A084WFS3_ANOSI|nr:hypothetical protein ZHAS_00017081 [Anopheles sinensis]
MKPLNRMPFERVPGVPGMSELVFAFFDAVSPGGQSETPKNHDFIALPVSPAVGSVGDTPAVTNRRA